MIRKPISDRPAVSLLHESNAAATRRNGVHVNIIPQNPDSFNTIPKVNQIKLPNTYKYISDKVIWVNRNYKEAAYLKQHTRRKTSSKTAILYSLVDITTENA